MKRRLGWVSNSSSSSFCILGVTDSEIIIPDDMEAWDLENDSILEVINGISDFCDEYCIGISPSNIGVNETILQAKQRVVEALQKKGIEVDISKVDFMTDGGYNG